MAGNFDTSFFRLSGDEDALMTDFWLLKFVEFDVVTRTLRRWKKVVLDDEEHWAAIMSLLGEDQATWDKNWQCVVECSLKTPELEDLEMESLDNVVEKCAHTVQRLLSRECCFVMFVKRQASEELHFTIIARLLLDIIADLRNHPGGYFSDLLGPPKRFRQAQGMTLDLPIRPQIEQSSQWKRKRDPDEVEIEDGIDEPKIPVEKNGHAAVTYDMAGPLTHRPKRAKKTEVSIPGNAEPETSFAQHPPEVGVEPEEKENGATAPEAPSEPRKKDYRTDLPPHEYLKIISARDRELRRAGNQYANARSKAQSTIAKLRNEKQKLAKELEELKERYGVA